MTTAELQTALYSVLSNALDVEVYDDVAQGSSVPYVTIGDITAVPFDTDDTTGFDCTATIHVWSRYNGRAECLEIQGDIYEALHRQNFAVQGKSFVGCTYEGSEVLLDVDGETRHGVTVFRILIEG